MSRKCSNSHNFESVVVQWPLAARELSDFATNVLYVMYEEVTEQTTPSFRLTM